MATPRATAGKREKAATTRTRTGPTERATRAGARTGPMAAGDPVCPITGEDVPRRPGLRLWRPDGAAPRSGTTTPAAPIGTAMSGTAGRTPSAGRSSFGGARPFGSGTTRHASDSSTLRRSRASRFETGLQLGSEPRARGADPADAGRRAIHLRPGHRRGHPLPRRGSQDRNGNQIRFQRDDRGQLVGMVDYGGTTVSHRQRQGRPDHLRPHRLQCPATRNG